MKKAPKTLSILACGWLGTALAKSLKQKYPIQTATQNPNKKKELSTLNITSHLLEISPNHPINPNHPILNCNIALITLPFKRALDPPNQYTQSIQNIANALPKNTWAILTSSTSIYPLSSNICTETSPIDTTPRAKALFEAENILRQSHNATILRLAGLYGPDRQPGKFLKHKKNIQNTPINLIHQKDCVEIIRQIIEKNIQNETYNLVSDTHPLKSDFYRPLLDSDSSPTFTSPPFTGKIVSNEKIKQALNYSFHYPDPQEHCHA